MRSPVAPLAVFLVLVLPLTALAEPHGALAEREMRALAEQFPGRMAGSERERAAAEYLAGRLADFGYEPVLRAFPVTYSFHPLGGGDAREREAVSHNVVAEVAGRSERLIIVGAHYDTAVARNAGQAEAGIGGPALEGVDDNASGTGALLELARRLADAEPEHGIRFIFFGAEEVGLLGARHAVAEMDEQERERVVLMINIDSIITGDRLYVHAGPSTIDSHPIAASTRDEALGIAAGLGIELRTNPGRNADYPEGTGCCSDQAAFDEAGIPVINLEATNWNLGDLDGYQQTEISDAFPAGETWHKARLDRLNYLQTHLPEGRLGQRPAEVVAILLPLIEQLSGLPAADQD
ncbi:aminopeptidase [Wenzhouxiangella limi]|uniref:Aminopeptidase n=1 Tax=Wenzhouxiangella limi TaxID=2707351 RepID=A0A845V8K9_9GAMM|nr:aminopeptidase [Wenzhouxiangella limi]NDY96501.1 aminopeptidase [Wenzhouxiangella limi]